MARHLVLLRNRRDLLVRLLASLSLQRGLPSSLAELSEHATLLCPAEFHPPKSVRRSPVGFIMSEQWPRGTLVTRLYEGGSLALSLIRLSGETRAHRSPSARPAFLTVRRLLYSNDSFHSFSSAEFCSAYLTLKARNRLGPGWVMSAPRQRPR